MAGIPAFRLEAQRRGGQTPAKIEQRLSRVDAEAAVKGRSLRVALPVDRRAEGQPRPQHLRHAVLHPIETGIQAVEVDKGVAPAARALNGPGGVERPHFAGPPVAPFPLPFIGPEIAGATVEVQPELAEAWVVRLEYRLQAAVDALRGEPHPRQRPARLIYLQRGENAPAQAQQRAGLEPELRIEQRPAEIARQRGVKLHRRQLAFASKAQRQRAVCHAQRSGADTQHRVAFAAASLGQHVEAAGNLRLFQTLPPVVEREIKKAGERLLAHRPAIAPFNYADLPRVGLPRKRQQRLAVAGGVERQLALLLLPVERQTQRFAGVLQLALQLTPDRQAVGELGQFEPAMQRHGLRQRVMVQRQLLYAKLLPLQAGVDIKVIAAIAQRLFSRGEAEIETSGVLLPGRDGEIIKLDIGAG